MKSESTLKVASIGVKASLIVLAASSLGWLYDSLVSNLYTVVTPQLAQAFHLTAGVIGLLSTLFLLGYAVGTLFGGTLADYIGRVRALGLAIITSTIFATVSGLAATASMLGIFRVLTGIGVGSELPVGATYVGEVAPTRWRSFWVGGILNSLYSLGIFVASALVAIVGNWRWAFGACLVLGALILFLRLRAVESPHYQAVQKALAEGQAVRSRLTVKDLTRPAYRGAMIRTTLLWMSYLVTWWGWSIFVPTFQIRYAHVAPAAVAGNMAIFGLTAFGMQLVSSLVADWLGRRVTIGVFGLLAIAFVWMWTFNPGMLLLGALSMAFMLAPPGVISAYTTEVFPTAIRGTGQSLAMGIARLVAAFAPFLAGSLSAEFTLGGEWHVISLVLLIMIAVPWFGPETKGTMLQDMVGLESDAPSAMSMAPLQS